MAEATSTNIVRHPRVRVSDIRRLSALLDQQLDAAERSIALGADPNVPLDEWEEAEMHARRLEAMLASDLLLSAEWLLPLAMRGLEGRS